MDPSWEKKSQSPKTTWWWTVTAELKDMNLNGEGVQRAAQDRSQYKQIFEALCPNEDGED